MQHCRKAGARLSFEERRQAGTFQSFEERSGSDALIFFVLVFVVVVVLVVVIQCNFVVGFLKRGRWDGLSGMRHIYLLRSVISCSSGISACEKGWQ